MLKLKRMALAFCIAITLVIFFGTTVLAAPSTTRLWGKSRYETAASICSSGWKQSDYAILANGENFPDALSAAPLAKKYNAPILLTPKDELDESIKTQLQNLKVKDVYIIGGTGVISPKVETNLRLMNINTTRIAGTDRYDTAIKVAGAVGVGSNGIVMTTGDDFPDAVSIAPIAAKKGMPIILCPKDYLTDSISKFLQNNYISQIYLVGGSDIISDKVVDQLSYYNVKRIIGDNKYERNAAIIKEFSDEIDFSNVCIANGENFPDALSGSVYASLKSSPIILVSPVPLEVTKGIFTGNSINQITILGGEGVISPSVVSTLSQGINSNNNSSDVGLTVKDISKNSKAVVLIEAKDKSGGLIGTGSGFIVSADGRVVTNYHVIEGAYSASAVTEDGTEYTIDGVLNYSKSQDFAVLKLKGGYSLPTVKLGDSSKIEIADDVVAIGSPEGYKNTVSTGIISGLNRSSTIRDGKDIQFTAAITYGSSGGCLLNMKGEVIGITYSGYETGNLGFAIPINEISSYISEGTLKKLSEINKSEKPETPNGVTAWSASGTEIRLKWNEVYNADYYKVYACSSYSGSYYELKNKDGENKWYWFSDYCVFNSNLSPNTKIYYKVTAMKDGVESDYSTVVYATTSLDKPLAPAGVSALAASATEIDLKWDKIEDADYYKIYESHSYSSGFYDIENSKGENKWYWSSGYCVSITNIEPGTTWYYKIAVVKNGIESDCSSVVNATTLSDKPKAPTGVTAEASSNSEIQLKWNKVDGIDYYKIYESSSYSGRYYDIKNSRDENKWYWTSGYCVTISNIEPNTTWYYKITAVKNGVESDYSSVAYATTLKNVEYFIFLSDVPCVDGASYIDYDLDQDGFVIYTYKVSDLSKSIVSDYEDLLIEEGWDYIETRDTDDGGKMAFYSKNSNLISISFSSNYMYIMGKKH